VPLHLENQVFSGRLFALLLLAAGLFAPHSAAHAEDRWVTDQFEVMMRSGKSTQQSIVRQLKSGTQVEVLETDKEAGYTRVKVGSGAEGWVLTRYLQRQPPARLQVPDLESRLRASDEQQKRLREQAASLQQERNQLQRQLDELQSNNTSTQKQLERITRLSADTVAVDEQNRQLKQRLVDSERQIDELTAENRQLASRANREWFLIGGAVLMAGLLLGLILPRIRWKKKSSWSDF
jgi:SH3 domain protein